MIDEPRVKPIYQSDLTWLIRTMGEISTDAFKYAANPSKDKGHWNDSFMLRVKLRELREILNKIIEDK